MFLPMDDSVIRPIESGVCHRCFNHMVTCLPDVKVEDSIHCLDKLIDNGGQKSAVMLHIDSNNTGKCSCVVLEREKIRLLGSILRSAADSMCRVN